MSRNWGIHPRDEIETQTRVSDGLLMLIKIAAPVAMLTYIAIGLWIGFHG